MADPVPSYSSRVPAENCHVYLFVDKRLWCEPSWALIRHVNAVCIGDLDELLKGGTPESERTEFMALRFGRAGSARIGSFLHFFRQQSTSMCSDYWDSLSTAKPLEKKEASKSTQRLASVSDVIHDRKLPTELRGRPNSIRSETDITNVVEQRIWKSMEEGQFENLPGKGKPLNLSNNPHADPADDTLYRILSRNRCAPEWIELNKEIRTKIADWRRDLRNVWKSRSNESGSEWKQEYEVPKTQTSAINDMVFRYNLIVPFGRQMFGLNWEKELQRLEETD